MGLLHPETFCCCMSLRTGVIVLSTLEFLSSFSTLLDNEVNRKVSIIFTIISGVCAFFGIVGAIKRNASYVKIYYYYCIFNMILFCIFFAIWWFIPFFLIILLNVYFFCVVREFYHSLVNGDSGETRAVPTNDSNKANAAAEQA